MAATYTGRELQQTLTLATRQRMYAAPESNCPAIVAARTIFAARCQSAEQTDRRRDKRLPCSERSLLHEPSMCGTDDHRCLLPSWPCSRSCFWASLPAFNARQPSHPFYWTQVWVACRSWPDDVRLLLACSSATAHVSNP